MTRAQPARIPVSTYRLQFNARFPFAEAERLVPYLERLGITECYCSSLLAAKPGSTHGYDICDHSRINPELGGEEGFRQFAAALGKRGLGLILDFVPNHMSTDPSANAWWRNVLENGPSSPFAKSFDIDWDPVKVELKNKVLLPVLGDQYGVTLNRGELQLAFRKRLLLAALLRSGSAAQSSPASRPAAAQPGISWRRISAPRIRT